MVEQIFSILNHPGSAIMVYYSLWCFSTCIFVKFYFQGSFNLTVQICRWSNSSKYHEHDPLILWLNIFFIPPQQTVRFPGNKITWSLGTSIY